MSSSNITVEYINSKYSTEYHNIDNPDVQAQAAQELQQAVADQQQVTLELSTIKSDIAYNNSQINNTTTSIDSMYVHNPELANSTSMNNMFKELDTLKDTNGKYIQQQATLEKCKVLLQERIAYLNSILGNLNKLNPVYIPFNYKLETQNFNKIAHFRVLEQFHEVLKGYLTPVESIYAFKSELFYAAIDSDTSFRFIKLPLFMQSITYGSIDDTQITPLMGDYFHSQFFGRLEQVITIDAYLLDTPETKAFATITMLYMDFFRLSHVSRVGVPLTLEFGDKLFTGAFKSMNINKNSIEEDLIEISFEFLVLEYTAYTEYNKLPINNVHTVTW